MRQAVATWEGDYSREVIHRGGAIIRGHTLDICLESI